ncbi:MAG TPA: F0F1 ATP synthase subunit gamma [Thermodesulfobacteriota bacterium]|nr:F0F1 ATP synthase subunit gamma [Thermodesulfobacteriota bacterium]
MQSSEELHRQISSTEDLQSVVKTMKALAAVNIRQYERAAQSIQGYFKIAEQGLQVILASRPELTIEARPAPIRSMGALVFGSDQGLCGPLNEQVAQHTIDTLHALGMDQRTTTIQAVGERAAFSLAAMGWPVQQILHVPGSLDGITPLIQGLVTTIESWSRDLAGATQVYLFYSEPVRGTSSQPDSFRLLPIDQAWLREIRKKPWPTRMIPLYTMDWEALFSLLVREYLFATLFRALADSLASENAQRLAAMERAERNIEERLSDLHSTFHEIRQTSITDELLTIVGGFEALEH